MNVKLSELESLLVKSARRFVKSQEAEYFSELTIDTHLKKSPRTNPLKEAVKDLEKWSELSENSIDTVFDKPGSTLLDFNGLPPALKIRYIHEVVIKKAVSNGIGCVAVNNSGGFHTLNIWTDVLGREGFITLLSVNGGPGCVVPFGSKGGHDAAIFGTNPISYSIPTHSDPIIADMATSQIPFFQMLNSKKDNVDLPGNAAVNKDGKPDKNPQNVLMEGEYANILPMGGGYKGYALTLFLEVLTGSLVRSLLSTEMNREEFIPDEHGALLIAIDVASFTDLNKFKDSVTALCERIRALEPREGVEGVIIPGDNSYSRRDKILAAGELEVEEELVERLKGMA